MPNTPAALERKRRYRDRHREKLRAQARSYAARKRRASGMPARGTPESHENLSRARKAKGVEHGNWKGDDVGYGALHIWLHRHKHRTGICEWCGDRPFPSGRLTVGTQFANLSGEYLRDVRDYAELCPTCHIRFDRGLLDPPERKAA